MGKKDFNLKVKDTWNESTQGLTEKECRIINDKVLNHIAVDPKNSEYLHFDLEGLRSYRLPSGKRIIFAICNECREKGFEKANGCRDCAENPDNTIILFAFGEHDPVYNRLGRQRKYMLKNLKRKLKKSR